MSIQPPQVPMFTAEEILQRTVQNLESNIESYKREIIHRQGQIAQADTILSNIRWCQKQTKDLTPKP